MEGVRRNDWCIGWFMTFCMLSLPQSSLEGSITSRSVSSSMSLCLQEYAMSSGDKSIGLVLIDTDMASDKGT